MTTLQSQNRQMSQNGHLNLNTPIYFSMNFKEKPLFLEYIKNWAIFGLILGPFFGSFLAYIFENPLPTDIAAHPHFYCL